MFQELNSDYFVRKYVAKYKINFGIFMICISRNILLPYRIIGKLYILRETLTINFGQENMRYMT
jgi:hypothetical protein